MLEIFEYNSAIILQIPHNIHIIIVTLQKFNEYQQPNSLKLQTNYNVYFVLARKYVISGYWNDIKFNNIVGVKY